MRTWLLNWWDSLRTNFWFVPSLMVASAVLLSVVTLGLDRLAGSEWISTLDLTYSRGPEGSRALLSTVAGSMVTIASLTFSITIVSLQLASSQFGPRLLRSFVRDLGNQVVLGTFIATFTYCLLILRTVNGTEEHEFVPHISVLVGMVLTLFSLGVLIYFIHHTASAIQAESVIASVGDDLRESLDSLFPDTIGDDAATAEPSPPIRDLPEHFDRDSRPIFSPQSNYIQAVDSEQLLELASERDLVLVITQRPGRFVVEGQTLARAWPAFRVDDELFDKVRGAFYFGSRRTLTQNAEFAIDQLVEVAVRALSPGINDPFTAVSCVDRLGAAICHVSGRKVPSSCRVDEEGRLRVVANSTTMADLADSAFHQIRQAARTNAAVTIRLLETFAVILPFARDTILRESILHHASLVHQGSQDAIPEAWDRAEAAERYRSIIEIARSGVSGSGD